jgi:hypothetical protein
LKAESRAKRGAAKAVQREVTKELRPLSAEIWGRFDLAARKLLKEIQARNAEEAARFDIPNEPTPLEDIIKTIIRGIPQKTPMANIAISPKSIFEGLL